MEPIIPGLEAEDGIIATKKSCFVYFSHGFVCLMLIRRCCTSSHPLDVKKKQGIILVLAVVRCIVA